MLSLFQSRATAGDSLDISRSTTCFFISGLPFCDFGKILPKEFFFNDSASISVIVHFLFQEIIEAFGYEFRIFFNSERNLGLQVIEKKGCTQVAKFANHMIRICEKVFSI